MRDGAGGPFGVQIIGRRFDDAVLALGAPVERLLQEDA